MSDSKHDGEAVENPLNDPEIAALLDFVPVPRKSSPPGAWTPEAQRLFIAWLAVIGSQGKACARIGKDRGGATKLYNSAHAASFRAAWHKALDLFEQRQAKRAGEGPPPAERPPTIDARRKYSASSSAFLRDVRGRERQAGQVLNERGEWEDEESMRRRAEDSGHSICGKLLRCRRMFLMEICDSPGKRAAFEILTELPIDWDRAARGEAQLDEPWRRPKARDADMVLTAESGWMMGEQGYGPDKKAELRQAIDEWRAAEGLEPVDWDGE